MSTIRFILEIEDVDNEDFNITDKEAARILNELEDLLNKQNYTIFNTGIEREGCRAIRETEVDGQEPNFNEDDPREDR